MDKKAARISGLVIGLITMFLCLICPLTILTIDWVVFKIGHQIWLNQDPRRFDFTGYDTAEELREDLLVKLPVGSSEEKIQAFRVANGEPYREPSKLSTGEFGIGMKQWTRNVNLFRIVTAIVTFEGYWMVFFELDPDDHTLVDIRVKYHPGP